MNADLTTRSYATRQNGVTGDVRGFLSANLTAALLTLPGWRALRTDEKQIVHFVDSSAVFGIPLPGNVWPAPAIDSINAIYQFNHRHVYLSTHYVNFSRTLLHVYCYCFKQLHFSICF